MEAQRSRFRMHGELAKERKGCFRFLFAYGSLHLLFLIVKLEFMGIQRIWPEAQKGFFVPRSTSLKGLAREARDCNNCELWRNAMQTVFG